MDKLKYFENIEIQTQYEIDLKEDRIEKFMTFIEKWECERQVKKFNKEILDDEFIGFSTDINVLIHTDRLYNEVKCLKEYIDKKTNLNIIDFGTIAEIFSKIDILIIAGLYDNDENYKIIEMLKELNKNIIIIMWVSIDRYTDCLCKQHKIEFQFDRVKPLKEFICFMKNILLYRR